MLELANGNAHRFIVAGVIQDGGIRFAGPAFGIVRDSNYTIASIIIKPLPSLCGLRC
jgi:hypothetical protein